MIRRMVPVFLEDKFGFGQSIIPGRSCPYAPSPHPALPAAGSTIGENTFWISAAAFAMITSHLVGLSQGNPTNFVVHYFLIKELQSGFAIILAIIDAVLPFAHYWLQD
jgi:hypothetical protein